MSTQPSVLAGDTTRLKREDRKRIQHDSHFSKWKILVGSDDWEDYSAGKEGAARYRVENLPRTSGSGFYELAIYPGGSSSGRVDPHKVLVVYIGEADNVRTRLQQYGRTGAHLGRSCLGCFEDIFSRGCSIVYRWAPMENKVDAQKTEAQLLDTFDYAWNKGSNGVRRQEDILQKLDKLNPAQIATFCGMLLPFYQKRVGTDIISCKLLADENEFSKYAYAESYNILPKVFKFSSTRPKLVLELDGSNGSGTIICGVVSADGTICERPPVEGRKRCTEHKGKKTKGSSVLSSTSEKSQMHKSIICERPSVEGRKSCTEHKGKTTKGSSVPLSTSEKSQKHKSIICERPPVEGGKRCTEHKGKTTSALLSTSEKSQMHKKSSNLYGSSISSNSICGAPTCNGSPCQRTVNGEGRCWQHLNHRSSTFTAYLNYGSKSSSMCGAPTCHGSPCKRTASENGRCWQHLNYGVGTRYVSNFCTGYSNYGDSTTSICRAPTRNGSFCRRPVKGYGRCWQH